MALRRAGKATEPADVLIIGSGHSGGMAAKILTEHGISCVMLNAGPVARVGRHAEQRTAASLPYRGFHPPDRLGHIMQASEFDANVWVDERQVPYTCEPGSTYNWPRVRLFGGRSLFWSRQSLRLSDFEFKAKSHDGFGDDWPISHADLDPFYAKVEGILRVRGGQESFPSCPGGNFIIDGTPVPESLARIIGVAAKRGAFVGRQRESLGVNGLSSSINLLLPDAFKTGKLKALDNVVVRDLTTDKDTGLINGAKFVHRLSRREMSIKARVVVLAAGALESTRLLLNSGIANSSGVLGHYLADQCYGAGISCSVPEARNGRSNSRLMGGGAFAPRFRNIADRSSSFIRGYGFNITSHSEGIGAQNFAEYGEELERKIGEYNGSALDIGVMAEVVSRYENHVRINKDVVDNWGIPVLHVDTKYGDNELNLCRDAMETAAEWAEAAGFEVLAKNADPNPPGYSIHEVGTCRMGNDPKLSVLNKWGQSHDIKNLFVVDGSAFVSAGWQNPTLTILALAMRSSQFLAEQMRVGAV